MTMSCNFVVLQSDLSLKCRRKSIFDLGNLCSSMQTYHGSKKLINEDLKVSDDGILINYFDSGYYSSFCLIFNTRHFGDWIQSPETD
jgi:hypothetical protein